MTNIQLSVGPSAVQIMWPDGKNTTHAHIWLRDNCPSGFHPKTQEREFDLTSVPPDIKPVRARIDSDDLLIDWVTSGPVSRFSLQALREHKTDKGRADPAKIGPDLWRNDLRPEAIPRARAADLLASKPALLEWLKVTKRIGLSIVVDLDDDPDAGAAIARKIGFLRETNFGTMFEVISKPDPNNLAYTSHLLPLHTDLPNQEVPPGYQFLHCIANEAAGGGSLFCDGYAIAEDLREQDSEAFALLTGYAIPFRFHDEKFDIRQHHPVIKRSEDGAICEIRFNAHLADQFDLPDHVMVDYYRAYHAFMLMSRDDKYIVMLKLRAGEMVVFDNRRVLHGRDAFDPSTGHRHLRGCYVDRGEFDSRLRLLSR